MRLRAPDDVTSSILSNRTFTRLLFFRRRWLLPILVRINLPEPVYLKRFEVALCVFIFGISILPFRLLMTGRFADALLATNKFTQIYPFAFPGRPARSKKRIALAKG
jgi:hypothetical protein